MSPDELPSWFNDVDRRPLVVGVLNATPDSFSDGGLYLSPEDAAERVRAMAGEGADWIDVGGESTRPGSEPVEAGEQIHRVLPAVRAAVARGVVVSIDTADADVADAALGEGASIINDVTAGRGDERMSAVMCRATGVVLMHMLGTPRTMQQQPTYGDVVAEVASFLQERVAAVGVEQSRVMLDPGIGFGKTMRHNLDLLAATRRLADLGHPLLIGTSRKRFIGTLTGELDSDRRQFGTAATAAWAITHGAVAVRVHDVRAMRQVVDVTCAMMRPELVESAPLR